MEEENTTKKVIDQGGYVYQPYKVVSKKDSFKTETVQGITRRDWLAGVAMQGLCADPVSGGQAREQGETFSGYASKLSYKIADAMIAEGKKTG